MFSIKYHESIVFRSKNLLGLVNVKITQYLDEETKKIVCLVIQYNGYFVQSECLLLSMIVDHDENIRKMAFFRIIKWLKSATNGQKDTTMYKILQCTVLWWYNFLVNREYQWRWIGLFWIHHLVHFEPPVLSNLSEEDLRQVVAEGRVRDAIYGLPSKNQSMERAINLVSQTSEKVRKEEDGEWIIHIVIAFKRAFIHITSNDR